MAGLFPENGVVAQETIAASFPLTVAAKCDALFHKALCVPRFDPIAANAIISELVNAININTTYDCKRLDNLATALKKIGSICSFPNAAANELVDTTAFGICAGSTNKKISWKIIREALAANVCDLPNVTDMANADSVAGCFGGESSKISVSDFRDALLNFCNWQSPAAITGNDSVVGCFGGNNRRVTMTALRNYILNICSWNAISTPTDAFSVAGCADGNLYRMTLADLRTAMLKFCGLDVRDTVIDSDLVAGCFGGASRVITVATLRAKLSAMRIDAGNLPTTSFTPSTADPYISVNGNDASVLFPRFAEVGVFEANTLPANVAVANLATFAYRRWLDNPAGPDSFFVAIYPNEASKTNGYKPNALVLPLYANPARQGSVPSVKLTRLPGDPMLYAIGQDGCLIPLLSVPSGTFFVRPLYQAADVNAAVVRWSRAYGIYTTG